MHGKQGGFCWVWVARDLAYAAVGGRAGQTRQTGRVDDAADRWHDRDCCVMRDFGAFDPEQQKWPDGQMGLDVASPHYYYYPSQSTDTSTI